MNLLLSLIYLLLSFTITILCFKKYGKFGLYIWICISVIICNIQTIKVSEIFGLTISLGNISYGSIFLSTDILSEKYGEKSTKQSIKLSFITMILFTVFMQIFLKYNPSSIDTSSESLKQIFNCMPRITIGSLLAYYVSQTIDTKLYCYLKKKYNKVWISNNVSTFLGQIFDTIIFVSIAFYNTMPISNLLELSLTMIIFKWVIAILDTPFMILVTKIKNNELN